MKRAIRINPADTVAVALQPLAADETIDLDGLTIQLVSDIPAGHKFALHDIPANKDIIKYGDPIGHAVRAIRKGEIANHHNIATNLSGTVDYCAIRIGASTSGAVRGERVESLCDDGSSEDSNRCEAAFTPHHTKGPLSFMGFPRPDGQVGIRNDIWVIPTVGCVNGICRQIVERARMDSPQGESSILYFPHNYGCSQLGDDHENTRLILRDMVLHPNAGGVLVVGLGCENNQPKDFEKLLGDYDCKRIRFLIAQEVEGDEVEAGVQIVKELYEQAQTFERVAVPLSHLRVGLKCGGSDGFSGITANPLLGAFSDWLCAQGGTTILTEVPEMFGAEHLLMRRAASDDVLQATIRLINDFKEYYLSHGQPVGENPSPGNKAGGISTLEEKALGCTQKSGTSPVVGVLKYGERLVTTGGLHLLSAPGNDLVASTALAAAGCQLVLFTTGRGTPFSTFVPTLKVSTNSELAHRKPQWIDYDAGVLLEDVTMNELLQQFTAYVIDVVSGRSRTTAEEHGNAEFAIFKTGVTL